MTTKEMLKNLELMETIYLLSICALEDKQWIGSELKNKEVVGLALETHLGLCHLSRFVYLNGFYTFSPMTYMRKYVKSSYERFGFWWARPELKKSRKHNIKSVKHRLRYVRKCITYFTENPKKGKL